jgi:PhzF family phenazine biosynthesis protein
MHWLTTKCISTFTGVPYAGNPAWVIIGAQKSEEEEKLLKVVSELNPVSDTVFIFPTKNDADFYLRFFSRSEEIDFSGHGTIAAYYGIINENLLELKEPITLIRQKTKTGVQHIELRLKSGKIERVTVSLPVPQFVSTQLEIKRIARFLGISPVDVIDATYPLGVVSSGVTDIIVPVRSLNTLLDIKPNFQLMKNYCERLLMTGVVVYSMETFDKNNTVHMRHFAPTVGIDEDPVSGAASASLGCYMVKNRIVQLEEMTRIVVEQGNSMGRPGLVYIHVHSYKNQIMKVAFGGQGVVIFEGRVLLP